MYGWSVQYGGTIIIRRGSGCPCGCHLLLLLLLLKECIDEWTIEYRGTCCTGTTGSSTTVGTTGWIVKDWYIILCRMILRVGRMMMMMQTNQYGQCDMIRSGTMILQLL